MFGKRQKPVGREAGAIGNCLFRDGGATPPAAQKRVRDVTEEQKKKNHSVCGGTSGLSRVCAIDGRLSSDDGVEEKKVAWHVFCCSLLLCLFTRMVARPNDGRMCDQW